MNRNNMKQTYDQMKETIDLYEVSLGRAGSTLYFATQVRTNGQQLEQIIGKAKSRFKESKSSKTIEEKIDHLVDGMAELSDAIYLQRKMIRSLTGLGLSAALTQARTDKDLQKLLKGKGRR